ncbi:hypothetical protein N7537_010497 [Penicillium hordei]|uniref:F-box domain-containing protein n=1 Tax=Penicillium hordei TaxID=40994 RepID=A0AAD6GWR0_9EURO|nr:uncharacterized protein N7537_010497 [Penicillium hordei]KAJ5593593.1 hypothetical protein N7537_010497 [Penicillium hordei]
MLEIVPCEILLDVADLLPPDDLRSLSQVCSTINAALVPLIYRTVTFRAASEWALNVLDIDSFFRNHAHSQPLSYLHHTRDLNIQAPIYIARFNRCVHHSTFRTSGLREASSTLGTSDEAKAHRHFLDDISEQMHLIFACLKENSLRSFQWHLGTCVPPGILDENGYICRHHKGLRKLSLITDGSCPQAGDALDGLSEFSSLKILEWEGIQQPAEADSLRRCIRQNAAHLTNLSIGFVSFTDAPDLFDEIFGQQSGMCHSSALPSLSSLALCKVPFPQTLHPSLALSSLSRSQDKLQLTLFEFACDNLLNGFGEDLTPVVSFLASFKGLRHLYLKLSNFEEPSRVESVIRHHQSTLESLSYHERRLVPIDDEGLFEEERDVSPQWICDQRNIWNPSCLSALGLCSSPPVLRLCLEPLARHSIIEILHIRFTGSERFHRDIPLEIITRLGTKQSRDIYQDYGIESAGQRPFSNSWSDLTSIVNDGSTSTPTWETPDGVDKTLSASSEAEEFLSFAEWAFGPTGLPKLQVLAFGDFSHKDQFQKQQFLTRRRFYEKERRYNDYQRGACGREPNLSPSFHAANPADISTWEDLRVDGARFLSACPAIGLIESPYE